MKLLTCPSYRCALETCTCKCQHLEHVNLKFSQTDLHDLGVVLGYIERVIFFLKVTIDGLHSIMMFLCMCTCAKHILGFVTSFPPLSITFIFMVDKSHFEVSWLGISFPVKFHGSSHFPGSHL